MRLRERDSLPSMENAVSKASKRYHGVVAIGRVLKVHSHDTDIIDHRGTDGRNEKKNCGREQEERANVVKETGLRHLVGLGFCCWYV